MSTYIRKNPLGTNAVLFAPERGLRPSDFAKKNDRPSQCPFCPGNEHLTPLPERLRFNGNDNLWELRAFPNKYPAAKIEGRTRFVIRSHTAFAIEDAHGAHEVIVQTPVHNENLDSIPEFRLVNLFRAIVIQTTDLYQDLDIKFIQVFINHGYEAGASLEHPHAQLIGLPYIPEKVRARLHRLETYAAEHGHPIFEEDIAEAEQAERIVTQTDNFTVLVPFAAGFPFEMWLMPLKDQVRLCEAQEHFCELAKILKECFCRLKATLGFLPSFNLVLDELPPRFYHESQKFYRWRFRIFPRLLHIAGFELGTGLYINPTLPEETAKFLREAYPE